MRALLCNILRASCILPWSAGLVKERHNGRFSVHDGSIAGLVLLTTIVIIIFEIIFVLPMQKARWLMVGLVCVAIVCLLLCSVLAGCRSHWKVRKNVKPSDNLKLKFLWVFCLSNIVYQAMSLTAHVWCNVHEIETALYCGSTWTFQLLQTVFIHYFSRFRFANILSLYYGLLVLFVTNISMWTQTTISSYLIAHIHHIPTNTTNMTSNDSCLDNNDLSKAVKILGPYLEPVALEYCLLSLIFISEMWPNHNNSTPERREKVDDLFTFGENNESEPLLMSINNTVRQTESEISYVVLVISLVYTFTFVLVQSIFIYVPEAKHYLMVSYILFCCGNAARIPLTIKCFYAFSGQLRPKQKSRKWLNLNHFVILTASFATCGFYVVECFTGADVSSPIFGILYPINTVLRVIATVLQTSFILQMKQYRKTGEQKSCCSIQNTFLFMCCMNLGFWVSYTFLSNRYMSNLRKSFRFENFYFSFVVFYHFECFISFFRFFTK